MTFKERLKSLGYDSYEAYLASGHWQSFKAKYRSSGKPMRCAVCSAGLIQLHHHTYNNLGSESLDDVTPLCRAHHVAVHEKLKGAKKFVTETGWAIQLLKSDGRGASRPRESKKSINRRKRRITKLRRQQEMKDAGIDFTKKIPRLKPLAPVDIVKQVDNASDIDFEMRRIAAGIRGPVVPQSRTAEKRTQKEARKASSKKKRVKVKYRPYSSLD